MRRIFLITDSTSIIQMLLGDKGLVKSQSKLYQSKSD